MKKIIFLLLLCSYFSPSAYSSHYYVDPVNGNDNNSGNSWDNAFKTLVRALEEVYVENHEIRLLEGYYYPDDGDNNSSNQGETFYIPGNVKIEGGWYYDTTHNWYDQDCEGHPSILSGEIDQDDKTTNNAQNIVTFQEGADSDTQLSCLTIEAGYADGIGDEKTGAAIFMKDANPVIEDCIIRDNYASSYGGGVYLDGSSPHFEDCTFTNNASDKSGGGIYSTGGNPTFEDCTFSSNTATEDGAGIAIISGTAVSFSNCNFTGNAASDDGGGSFFSYSTITFDDCDFSTNSAVDKGGGTYLEHNSTLTVSDGSFFSNTCSDGAALYNSLASTADFDRTDFYSNTATGEGGAIKSADTGSDLSFNHCNIYNNTAAANGGGIAAANITIAMDRTEFYGNTAVIGAALYVISCTSNIEDTDIHNNVASSSGGGIYCSAGSISISDHSKIYENEAAYSSSGGGICVESASVTIDDTEINENQAGIGGGIWLFSATSAEITDTEINENTSLASSVYSGSGGGIYSYNTILNISDCEIEENEAAGLGGGVYCSSKTTNIFDTSIKENTAETGGAVYAINATLNITPVNDSHLYIEDNAATEDAGGIYAITSNVTLTQCKFRENVCGGDGSAFVLDNGSSLTLNDVLVSDNVADAGSGISLDKSSLNLNSTTIVGHPGNAFTFTNTNNQSYQFKNTVVWNNGTSWANAPAINLNHSLVEGVVQSGLFDGTNPNNDPRFISPRDLSKAVGNGGDYHLQPNSPLINQAVSDPNMGEKDAYGNSRISGEAMDIGAAEYQITDLGYCSCTTNGTGKDFRYTDFSTLDMSNLPADYFKYGNFQGANLKGLNFSGKNLAGANFYQATLSNDNYPSDFSGANLAGACLLGSVLKSANMSETTFNHNSFKGVNFSGNNFTNATLSYLDFREVALVNSINFTNATMRGLNFSGLDLRNSIFGDLNILPADSLTDFSHALVYFPQFRLDNITDDNYQEIIFDFLTIDSITANNSSFANHDLSEARLSGCNFPHLDFTNVNFTNATLTGANFSYAKMSGANFTNASLQDYPMQGGVGIKTNFGYAEMENTTFDGSNIAGTLFNNANLSSASFAAGMNIESVDFQDATLIDANFDNTFISGTNFTGSFLQRAIFTQATISENQSSNATSFQCSQLGGADFSSATISGTNFEYAVIIPQDSCCQLPDGSYNCGTANNAFYSFTIMPNAVANSVICPNPNSNNVTNNCDWTLNNWNVNDACTTYPNGQLWTAPDCDSNTSAPDSSDYITFTDPNLLGCLQNNYFDGDASQQISKTWAAQQTDIDVSNCEIENLAGMEYFTRLTNLQANSNSLTDGTFFTKLPKLQVLKLNYNKLEQFDFSCDDCNDLTWLELSGNNNNGNKLNDISLGANVYLTQLIANENNLSSFDLSLQPNLITVDLSYNDLSGDAVGAVSNLSKLTFLNLSNNDLTTIDTLNSAVCEPGASLTLNLTNNPRFECESLWSSTSELSHCQKSYINECK